MAESGCLRDGHFQNLEVSGKSFFSRANTVTQTASSANVTSNGATGTIVLASRDYNNLTTTGNSGVKLHTESFWLYNNHINKESNVLFTLDHNCTNFSGPARSINNLAFAITVNETQSLHAGVRVTAIGNGRVQGVSIGQLNYLVIN